MYSNFKQCKLLMPFVFINRVDVLTKWYALNLVYNFSNKSFKPKILLVDEHKSQKTHR